MIRPGDRVKVFDDKEWTKTGDIGDNSQFYKPATVVDTYYKDFDKLTDVIFDHRPYQVSRGHLTYAIKPIE